MDKSKLVGKTVLVKFIEADTVPVPVTIECFDENGIWTREPSLVSEMTETYPVLQQVSLGKQQLLFFPMSQLEWVMVCDEDSD